MLFSSWTHAAGIYAIFRGGRAAMTAQELEGYLWVRDHLPPDVILAVSQARSRGNEWLPVMTDRGMYLPGVTTEKENEKIIYGSREEILALLSCTYPTHVFLYTWTEALPESYAQNPELFPVIYRNNAVAVIELPKRRTDSCGLS